MLLSSILAMRPQNLPLSAIQVYFLFIGINLVMLAGTWKFFPEFRRLTLEEIDLVMESDIDPVKMSLKLQAAKEEKRKEERSRFP